VSGTVADLLAWAMALLLLAGAVSKLWQRGEFALAVEAYELLPERAVGAFALGFPMVELAAGLLLLPLATRPAGAVLALLVLAAVSAAILVNLRRGRHVLDCGCGGLSGRQPISGWLLLRNAGLALILLAAIGPATTLPLPATAAVLGAVVLVLVYAAVDQLLANALRMTPMPRAG
jgi:hypothetical protein